VSQKENYEIEHNDITQHYRSVHGPQWSERNDRQRIKLRDFQTEALTFLDMHFTSSGRHIDVDGKTCGAADFDRMITAQGGTYSSTFTSETSVLIVGTYTRKSKIEHAISKGIAVVPYSLLCSRVNWDITHALMMTLGKYVSPAPTQLFAPSQSHWEVKGDTVEGIPTSHQPLSPLAQVEPALIPAPPHESEGQQLNQSVRNTTDRPFRFSLPVGDASIPKPLILSAIKKSRPQGNIPINKSALNLMNQPKGFTPKYNSRPANVNRAESFIAISFTHENDEEYRAATSIRERSGKILRLIFSLDK
jgi:hypothetical protein